MYLKFGTYQYPDNAAKISAACAAEFSETGRPLARKYTVSVEAVLKCAEGLVTLAEVQADMHARVAAFELAHLRHNQNLVLYRDDGSASHVLLMAAGSKTGVRIVSGPNYPSTEGAELGTFRTVQVTYEATYGWGVTPDGEGTEDAPETSNFSESVSFSGGGKRFVTKEARNGPGQRQLACPMTPHVCVQSGTATGRFGYPAIPPPLFPQFVDDERGKVSRTSPQQVGEAEVDFVVTWEWVMTSPTPFPDALPHFWRNP